MTLFDFSGITDEQFWNEAEARVMEALHDYARRAANGRGLLRQLFADDAVQGFAFVDICRKRFDVVLMNPPFGETSPSSVTYIARLYPSWNNNLLCAFIQRAWEILLPQGAVGVIHDRTAILKSTYEDFRRAVLIQDNRLAALADLGWEVLDANVEVTTMVLRRGLTHKGIFVDARHVSIDEKGEHIASALKGLTIGENSSAIVLENGAAFQKLPNAVIGYDFPDFLRVAFGEVRSLEESGFKANQGHALKAEKHFRVWWEIPLPGTAGFLARMFNGAGFSPYSTALHDCVISATPLESLPKDTSTVLRNKEAQLIPGICFGKRGEYFCAHLLPKGHIFTVEGQSIPITNPDLALELLGLLNTPLVRLSLNKYCGQHKYSGYVNLLPYRRLPDASGTCSYVRSALEAHTEARRFDESQSVFSILSYGDSIGEYARAMEAAIQAVWTASANCEAFCHEESLKAYKVAVSERHLVESFRSRQPAPESQIEDADINARCKWLATHSVISHAVGCLHGRWDFRIAKDSSLAPKLPGPFDSLPLCPPAMLVGPDGFPATSGRIVSEEWLRARPDASSLPPEGIVRQPTILDSQYPIVIDWDGILVDGPDHPDDIVRRMQEVLEVLWGERAEAIEQEACEILGVKELRDYFRKPGNGGFWMDHVKRYSKSRRKAPIYWLLQSSKKNYALWLYYHRLDKDILFKALVNYVEPKLRLEESRLEQVRAQRFSAGTSGREAKQLERQLDRQEVLLSELRDFHDKLRRAADLHLEPDLNDGVVLNIAPLWELVPWGEAKKYWEELLAGKYEWSSIGKQLRQKGLVGRG